MEGRTLLTTLVINVDEVADVINGNGMTSLREAVIQANAATEDDVLINLPAATFTLGIAAAGVDDATTGDLNITNAISDILIQGQPGSIIDFRDTGGGISARVFEIASSAHRVELDNLTLRGTATGAAGGAILNRSFLELNSVLVELSSSDTSGGGLENTGTGVATIINSTFDQNQATGSGDGGAIFNAGLLTVAGSTFTNNSGDDGGAIGAGANSGSFIEASTFSSNTSVGEGGAIRVGGGNASLDLRFSRLTGNTAGTNGGGLVAFSSGASVLIDSSTIDGNTAAGTGGGLLVGDQVSIISSTIFGNTSNSGVAGGGGIRVQPTGRLDLKSVTLAGNVALAGSGGALSVDSGGVATASSSIFADSMNGSAVVKDVDGSVASFGANIVENGGGAAGFDTLGGDQFQDPLLDPGGLRDNGGPTPTVALQAITLGFGSNSPAIDAAGSHSVSDQRLVPRPAGSADIGAYEVDPLVYFVNTTADTPDANSMDNLPIDGGGNVSLRSAIMALNNFEGGNGVIILPPGQFNLTQTSGGGGDSHATNDLDIFASNVRIIGTSSLSTRIDASGLAGDGVDAGGNDRAIEITGSGTSISGVTIANGNAGMLSGGGILVEFGSLLLRDSNLEDNSAADGGGLATGFSSVDSLTLEQVNVFENTATASGGGLSLLSFFTQTPTITNSNIARNTAAANGGGVVTNSSLEITDSSLSLNSSGIDGGGIAFDGSAGGTLTVFRSAIDQNIANGFGGGIASSGLTEITDSQLASNTAMQSGGGIGATSGTVRIAGSRIIDNSAAVSGGGVALRVTQGMGPVPMAGPVNAEIRFSDISSNTAGSSGGGVANSGGELFLFTSSVTDNTATVSGGGLANTEFGMSEVVSSTFSGNTTAPGGFGGGVANDSGSLDITNATITLNTAASGGGIASRNNASTTVQNSIIAQNILSGGGTGVDAIADTVITTGGNNVVGVAGAGFVGGVNGDQAGTAELPLDARLAPLADNGGLTPTHALLTSGPASPAIDAGSNTNLDMDDAEFDVDQRGAERILGVSVDAGAYESGSNAIFVTTTQDVVDGGDSFISLREAIDMANAAPNVDTIVLPTGTYSLTLFGAGDDSNASGDLDITEEVTIVGYGMGMTVIDGVATDRVFEVHSTIATFLDMTIQNGRTVFADGGGIRAEFSTTTLERVEVADNVAVGGSGGGVDTFNPGLTTLNVRDSVFRNNEADSGGAINSFEDQLNVSGTIFDDNRAITNDGGAIHIFGADATIIGSQFTRNVSVDGHGGAIFIQKLFGNSVTIDASRFAGNLAEHGGGVSIRDETVVITGSEFADLNDGQRSLGGNQAFTGGGAIENIGGTLTVQSTRIAFNSSLGFGGGIINSGTGAVLTLEDSVVENNSANSGGGGLYTDQNATVRRSTFAANFASDGGGIDNGGTLLLVNSTLSGNMAFNQGGGLANRFSGTSTVEHSTITANQSGMGGGGIVNSGTTVSLKNTIVAGNFDLLQNVDLQGDFESNGSNLIGDVDGATGFPSLAAGDIFGGDSLTASVLTASNATLVQIDTASAHTLLTGDLVRIEGVTGNSAANGTFRVTVIDADSFTLADPNGFPVNGTGIGMGGQVFRLADAQLGPLQNNTTPDDPFMGQGPTIGGGESQDLIQPIAAAVPFTHRPSAGSPVIDAGDVTGIDASDNRGTGFPRNVDGDNSGGAAPDIGAVELLLTSVTGRKFNDTNGNGVQDMPLESGLSGVTVYADLNLNGRLDSGDRFTTTDFNGDYVLDLVPPGATVISEVLPDFMPPPGVPGFRQTFPFNPVTAGSALVLDAVASSDPSGVTVADIDGDGRLDVIYTQSTGNVVTVLRQQSDGSFTATSYGVGTNPVSVLTGDFNNDGFLDIVTGNIDSDNVTLLRNQGNGTFVTAATVSTGDRPQSIVSGDFDNDGNLDVATANLNSNNVTILTGNGMGGLNAAPFATVGVGNSPTSLVAADIDGDGWLDLATADAGSNQITLLVNQGTGMFVSSPILLAGSAVNSIDAADVDRDGLVDFVVGRPGAGFQDVAVILNRGSVSSFLVSSVGAVNAVRDVQAVDIDGDGSIDIAAVGATSTNNLTLFRSDPVTGTFQTGVVSTSGDAPQTLAIGDLNKDGRPEFVTVNTGSDDVTATANLTGSHVVTTATGVVTPGVDFGNQQLGSVFGFKFDDRNGDGVQNGFFDGFDAGMPDPLWQNEVGNWNVVSGEYVAASPGNSPLTYSSLPFILSDFEVTFNVNNVDDGGVFLRSTAFDPAEPSGVLLVTGTPATSGTGVYWHIVTNGVEGPALQVVGGLFLPGDDISIRVKVVGDTYSAFVNGAEVPDTTLTTSMFSEGRFALYSNSSQTFDNVSLPERGLPGVEIFLDVNDNGQRDPFEPNAFTQTDDPTTIGFDETGRYVFDNVVPGDVRVYEVVPSDFEQTTPRSLELTEVTEIASVGDNAVDSLIADLDGDGINDVVVLSQGTPGAPNLRVFDGTRTQYVNLAGVIAVGTTPEAVAAGDLDGDGDLDLAVSDSGSDTVQLFENLGGLSFVLRSTLTVPMGDMPGELTLSDVTGDGRADVVVANAGSPSGVRGVSIFTNNNSSPGMGNYSFTGPMNLNTGGQTVGLQTADLDNDGDADIVAVVADTDQVVLFENLGGTFGVPTAVNTGDSPSVIAVSDLDHDGRLDLIVGKQSPGFALEVYPGMSPFLFGPAGGLVTTLMPDSLAVVDLDGNGFDDIVFTDQLSGQIGVVENFSFGLNVFAQLFPAGSQITGISAGDVDGDGLADLVAVEESAGARAIALFNRSGSIPVFVSSGGTFQADFGNRELASVSGTTFRDLDRDGIQDMDEDGLGGLTVFVDENGNGQLDVGEPLSVSGPDGDFTILNVQPLVPSRLVVLQQPGFAQTFQLDAPASIAVDGGARSENIGDIVTTGDLDGDGRDEIISANFTVDTVSIISIDEMGLSSRTDVAVGDAPLVVRLADLNADGNADLVTANFGSGDISVLLGNGNGTFGASTQFAAGPNPQSLTIADFNGDGKLDVAVSSATSGNLQILNGDGLGGFSAPTVVAVAGVSSGEDLESADFDGDGDVDLAVVHANQNRVSILLNAGGGTFGAAAAVGVGNSPRGTATGDLDEDGDIDLVVTNTSDSTVQFLFNDGSGVFAAGSATSLGGSPEAVVIGDVNSDGHLDVVVANQAQSDVTVLLGDGSGGIDRTVLAGVGAAQDGVALGDLNGDGRLEIVAETYPAGTVSILQNLTGNRSLFLVPGEMASGQDFGIIALPGSISGVKFRDDNENGLQDTGEPGLAGVTIYLDLDNDDVLDGGEPSTTTDANGFYEFTGLEALQQYTVSELVPAGFQQFAPFDPGFAFSGDAFTGGAPAGIVTGDFDGMNGDDIAVTLESTGQVAILLRQAGGSFGAPTLINVGTVPFSIVAADFDGVNGLDLAVANEGDGTVTILVNNGSGTFTPQMTPVAVEDFPLELAVADIDGANGPDLIIVNDSNNSFQIALNNGSGVLSAQTPVNTGNSPSSVAVADYDGDGDLDVAVTTRGDNRLTIYLQTSPGTFTGQTPIVTGTDPARVRTADLNNDGTLDLVVVNQQSSDVTVVLNNSSGGTLSLGSPTNFMSGVPGESLVLADFNRDGFSDIATGGEDVPLLALLINDGLGGFNMPTLFDLDGTFPAEIAAITLNADGDVDLAITDASFNEILLLTSTTGSHSVLLGPGQDVSGLNFANRNLNQAPVISVPASQSITEDTSLVFSSGNSNVISFTDLDEVFNPVTSQFAVTLTVDVGTLTLSGTAGLDFVALGSVGDGTDDSTMVFTGSRAAINTALNGLTFSPPVNANGVATLTIFVDDQGNFGVGMPLIDQEIVTVNIAAVNDAPGVSGIEAGAVSYTENGAATQVTNALVVSDIDNANLQSATVSISANYQNGQDVLSATSLPTGITANFDAETGILTLSGSASVANYQTALRQVKYANTSESPVTLTRTLTFQVNDGSANSNTQSRNVTVTAVNDAPVVSGIEAGAVSYTENSPATQVTNSLVVSDVDNTNLQSARVSISANYQNGQDVLSATNLPTGITASFNAGTGILTLSGSASVANYQSALRQVTYANTSESPVTLSRTLTFRVNDGSANSNTQSRNVTVTSVNDVPAVSGIEAGAVSYTENSPATQVTNSLVLSDLDNANLQSARVSISANYQSGQDVLSAMSLPTGITADFNAGTGILTLSGSASVANYQSALRQVKYANTSESPVTLTRTLTFQVNDGSANSNTQSRNVTVTAVNDAPVVSGIEAGAVSYTENSPATQVTNSLVVSDVDNTNLQSARVSISANYQSGQDVLSAMSLPTGITADFNAGTGILTLSGSASVANYQSALRQVKYANTSDAPVTLSRTLTFRVNDGSANSIAQSRNVTVTAVNDAPVVSGIEAGAVSYTEKSSATQVTNSLVLSDLDNTNLQSARVSISANYQNGQDVLSATNLPTGITASFNAGTGILTLSGSASVANYQSALRQVTYANTSESPVTLSRTLTFRVNDGSANSNTQSRNVTVTSVNDVPVLSSGQLGAITYQNNAPAVSVVPDIAVNDVDNANLNSAVVRIQSGFESTDVLAGTATGGILVSYDAALGVLTLSGQSSLANYEAVLRSVSYVSTSSKPSVTTRRVSFVVNDGVVDSNVVLRDINVQLRPATVSGVVWADTTEDGLRDELEPRVEGVTVQVFDAEDGEVSSTVTGPDGTYVLSVPGSLLPDNFRVRFTAPDGKHFTARDVGGKETDAIDSDPNVLTGEAFVPNLGSGQHRQHLDAGLVNTTVTVADAEPENEGDGAPVSTLDFRVALNGRSPHQVTVNVQVVAGTDGQPVAQATVGTDVAPFPLVGGLLPVVFNPGQTERVVSVPIIGDTDIEPDEGVEVRLSSPIQAALLDPVGFGLIRNDDFTVPTIELGDDVSVNEGQFPAEPSMEFTVSLLGGAVSEDVAVSYRTVALPALVAGAATSEVDFRPVDDVVIIPAGQTSATIRVSVIGDSDIETDERFVVMLYEVDGGELEGVTLGMRTSGEGIIVNDDVFVPTASIADTSVRERNAPRNSVLQFPVTLDGPAATNTRIEYQILQLPGDGSAMADVDFVSFVPGPLVIPRGQTTGTISVIVRGDQIDELDEVLAVELVSVLDDNVTLGETLGVGTIVNDDDARLLVSINQGSQVTEGRGGQVTTFTMTVSLSGDVLVPSTVFVSTLSPAAGVFNAATPGIDFLSFKNRAVPIPAGQRTGTFQIDVLGDEIPEPDEFVFVSIVGVTEGIDIAPALGTATATINDDDEDRPTVSIDAASSTNETRPGLTSVVRIPVRLSSVSDEVVTVDFATVPSIPGVGLATDVDDPMTPQREDDFRATMGQVTFAPGQQVAFIQILVNGDEEVEPPETFAVDLTGVSPNVDLNPFAARSVATILDDNVAQPFVSLQAAATAGEPDGDGVTPVDLTVTLSGRLNSNVVVGYTIPDAATPGYATAVLDYVPVGRQEVVIEAGQTTATLTVLVTGDNIPEAVERFFVQLLDVSPVALIDQNQQQAEVTINDNDAALPTISITNASVQEGDPVGPDGVAPAQDPRLDFVISLDSVPVGPVTVEVETVRTDAAAPGVANTDGPDRDVFATRRILFFDPQITSQTFSVRVEPDDSFESDELVFIRVFNPVGAVLPNQTLQGVGTVINDDFDRPTVSITSTRLLEGDTPGEQVARLTVTLDADPESGVTPDVTVGFRTTGLSATEGVDFQSLSGELKFSDGVRSQTIDIPIIGDLDDETAEEFIVELFELDGTPLNADLNPAAFQGLVRIDNDDDPNVSFRIDNVRKREGTGGTTSFEFTVRRIGNSPSASTVNFATSVGTAEAGDDFAEQSGTLTFAPDGPDIQIISVAVVGDDDLEEEFETFFVTLSDPQNATVAPGAGQGVGTILDDDQRVFAEDANDELLEIAREIRDAIDRVGNDPNNPELLALLDRLNRELIQRVGPALAIIIDPVDFLLTDLESRTVGYTETSGEVSEVPRAFYSGDGDVELVIIPAAEQGIYGLQLSGVGSGEFRAVATLVTADGFSKTILNADTLTGDAELALDFTDDTALPIQGQVIENLAALNRASTPVGPVDEGTLAIADEVAAALSNVVSPDATITEQSEDDPFDPKYISDIAGILRNLASELSGHIDSLPDMDLLLDPEVEAMLDAVFSGVGRQALGAPANLMLDLIDLLGVFDEEDGESGSDDKANDESANEEGQDNEEDGTKKDDQGNADIERFLKSSRVAGAEKVQREALLWLEKRRRGELEKTSTDDVDSVFSQPNDIPVPENDRSVQARGTAETGRTLKEEPRADSGEEDSPEEAA